MPYISALSVFSASFAWGVNHYTDVLFPHAEGADCAKILLYNAIAGEVAGYARRENAEVGENQ